MLSLVKIFEVHSSSFGPAVFLSRTFHAILFAALFEAETNTMEEKNGNSIMSLLLLHLLLNRLSSGVG